MIYPRPQDKTLAVERVPVAGACPECGAHELQRYPVLGETGWWDVVKCQACLCTAERKPGPLYGPIVFHSSLLPEARG